MILNFWLGKILRASVCGFIFHTFQSGSFKDLTQQREHFQLPWNAKTIDVDDDDDQSDNISSHCYPIRGMKMIKLFVRKLLYLLYMDKSLRIQRTLMCVSLLLLLIKFTVKKLSSMDITFPSCIPKFSMKDFTGVKTEFTFWVK